MRRKGRKLVRMVSALLGKEKRGPSAQREGKETEVAGLRRANLGAAAGRSSGRRGDPRPQGPSRGAREHGLESRLAMPKLGVGEKGQLGLDLRDF